MRITVERHAVGSRETLDLIDLVPSKIVGIGQNYRAHALEMGKGLPEEPLMFLKPVSAIIPSGSPIERPGGYERVDYEGELGVVIGQRCRTVSAADALSERFDYEGELGVVIGAGGRYIEADDAFAAVAGFVVLNDGSAREWQRAATQWTPGKNFDATMPIGPELVTTDEIDVSDLALTTRLNGEVMQAARTSQMIIDVSSAVEFFSTFTTLRPGDVIATGTPGGVGFARKPPVWLQPGDTIEVEIEGIGTIRNRVVAEGADARPWRWRASAPQGASL